MKRFGLFVFLTFYALLAWAGKYDWDFEFWDQFMHFSIGPVTPEQAKEAIINWSGRQNLIIKLSPIYAWKNPLGRVPSGGLKPGGNPISNYTTVYAFSVKDPNPDKKYSGTVYVDSWSGAVMGISKSFGRVRDDRNIANMLTPQQALNRAKEFILSYFPDVPIDSLTPNWADDEPTEDGSSWKEYDDFLSVIFRKELLTPDGEEVRIYIQEVSISMDSNTGELEDIDYCYEPLEIAPWPTLTREEIAQAVTSYFYGLGAESVVISHTGYGWNVEREEPYGIQRLSTLVAFKAFPSPDLPPDIKNLLDNLNICFVDGHTGEVFYACLEFILGGPFGGIGRKEPSSLSVFYNGQRRETISPPFLQNGGVYISLEDVKKMGFRVGKKGYVVAYKGNRAELKRGDIISKDGREYIRGEALGKIKGVRVHYGEETKEFHILVLNEKLFQMGQECRAKLEKKGQSSG